MKLVLPLLVLCAGLAVMSAHADVVQMPQSSSTKPTSALALPVRGMSMAEVLQHYGEPRTRHATVGGGGPKRPPITRWDYPTFTVVFEHRTVLDTVVPGDPPKVYHRDQLRD